MTDIHGSEPDNREDTLPEADAQDAQDSITEVPSEYEFSDGLGSDETVEGKPARRSALLPIAAALGGIILLGGAAWWQLGGSPAALIGGEETVMPLPGAVSSLKPPTSPVALPTVPATPKNAATAPNEDSVSGTPSIASSSALPNEPVAPALQVKPSEATTQTAAPETSVVTAPLPAPSPAVVAQAPGSPISPVIPPATAPEAKVDPRIEALTARVDNLQKALDEAHQQLKTAGTAETAANANEAALQDRINKLEQQVAALTQKAPEAETAPAIAAGEIRTDVATNAAASKPKAVSKKATAKPATKKAAPVEKSTSWVLRSASPGTAWVSKTATSPELREIHVGDKLPGIGRVTAIETHGESWIVRGSSGSIH